MKIHAWAHAVSRGELEVLRNQLPGLGIIHYSSTYDAAMQGDIAFVDSVSDAEKLVSNKSVWNFAIVQDEPDSRKVTPKEYLNRARRIALTLDSLGIPHTACGLANPSNKKWVEKLIIFGMAQGVNFRPAKWREFQATKSLFKNRTFFPTLLPVRANWLPLRNNSVLAWLWQTLFVKPSVKGQFKRLSVDPQCLAVGVWCLRETHMPDGSWQGFHGLFDRHGEMTWQGHLVRELLDE